MIVVGQSVGNYRILSKIGTGGMGAVYLAEHPTIGKKVAFKVIHRDLAGNRDVVSRFFQEAKAVNRIGNEHIIEIHDFGVTPEGDHYYIMEYLEGQTLASLLSRETAIDVIRSMHIGAQIAAALDAAHAAGVIHRDLKPDNIMLTPRLGEPDFVKVLDFGLAKMFAAGTGVHTAMGVLLGTPQYMSPEACESKRELDGRTDIYALGVLLFQMMTGVLPFDGESMGEVLVKQVTTLPPAPRGLNPEIPPSVEQIVLRCLAKSADARFGSMLELRDALRDPDGYLRRSPPILPARSIAPGAAGVNAKQVMAYAAAAAAARAPKLADPASAVPTAAGGQRPGDMAGLAPPNAPANRTMRIMTPVGFVSTPPRRVWPFVVVIGILLGLGGGVTAVVLFGPPKAGAGATGTGTGGSGTAAADGGSGTAAAASGSGTAASGSGSGSGSAAAAAADGSGAAAAAAASGSGSGSAAAADGRGSAAAANGSGSGTGSAAAADGSGSAAAANGSGTAATANGSGTAAAGTGSGPVAAANGSGTAAAGTGSGPAVAATGSGPAATGTGSGSAVAAAVPPASGSAAGSGSALIAPTTATLQLDSNPHGAQVFSLPDNKLLGVTPVALTLPISTSPVTLSLHLAGYKDRTKELAITGNVALRVELDKRPPPVAAPHHPPHHPHAGSGSIGDGLVKPGDL